MKSIKLIVTSKMALQSKYGKGFTAINKKLTELVKKDKQRNLDTKVIYVDDAASAKRAGVKEVSSMSQKECKEVVDALYEKHLPAYIAIVGAQDVFPFQEINNPAQDDDFVIPTDLPYACNLPYSKEISNFTGPTRVVGRIPDVPGSNDHTYLLKLLQSCITYQMMKPEAYAAYFAVTAAVWKKSTDKSLLSIFGHNGNLISSPPQNKQYTKTQLKPLSHFINCHGAPNDYRYYGQKGNSYPDALLSTNLPDNITFGTVAAAECCYGADLVDPVLLEVQPLEGPQTLSIANTYLGQGAVAFMGSSTIAYGPADGQGLADLITQYYLKCVHRGASSGRALLEARQKFISIAAPHLDPYELKTLAQFYLLGDPSLQPVTDEQGIEETISKSSTANNRIRLESKGADLQNSVAASKKKKGAAASTNKAQLGKLLAATDFTNAKEVVYEAKPNQKGMSGLQKRIMGEKAVFRTFIKSKPGKKVCDYKVLVVKEAAGKKKRTGSDEGLLGWRIYHSK